MNLKDRFDRKWTPEPFSGCWLWIGCVNGNYGQLHVNHKMLFAHRVSWTIHKGDIPVGLQVLHRCDTPACVNPAHPFLGSISDNIRDSINKGRWNRIRRKSMSKTQT